MGIVKQRKINVIGKTYNRVTIIEENIPYVTKGGNKLRCVTARCKCGNKKNYLLCHIISGKTKSCGCYHKEKITTHGKHNHPLYCVWDGMRKRCRQKRYIHHHGKGIKVCKEWDDNFEKFYNFAIDNGWRKGLQIDRINNDGNYEPSNCRFVTRSINNMNKSIIGKVKYRGVSIHKKTGKFTSRIKIDGKTKYLGLFNDAKKAALAFDKYIKDNNLPNNLNFSEVNTCL